jgi:ribose transport system permease protein
MKKKFDFAKYAPIFALVILFIISAFASPYFLNFKNITNILRQSSYTGIIALGMTFVIISGGIDLSVGSMVALIGGIVILVLNYFGGDSMAITGAIMAGICLGLITGGLNGLIVTKGKIAPFIATLGTMSIFRSLTLYVSNAGEFRSASDIYPVIGSGYFLNLPIPVWIFLGLGIIFHILLNNTRYGRYVCAVGANEKVAVYSAIKIDWVKMMTYALTGLSVAVTSIMLSSRLNSLSSSNAGVFYELDAIAAVVIGGTSLSGGTGTITGTVIGAIILGMINNMLNMVGVSPYLQGTVKGLVIIFAVLVQYKRKNN